MEKPIQREKPISTFPHTTADKAFFTALISYLIGGISLMIVFGFLQESQNDYPLIRSLLLILGGIGSLVGGCLIVRYRFNITRVTWKKYRIITTGLAGIVLGLIFLIQGILGLF